MSPEKKCAPRRRTILFLALTMLAPLGCSKAVEKASIICSEPAGPVKDQSSCNTCCMGELAKRGVDNRSGTYANGQCTCHGK